MFGTLLIKEIREMIQTLRFLVAAVLCLVLIPLGIYVTLREYEQHREDYQRLEQLYRENAAGNIGLDFQAEGYRPPSPLSVFATGLEYYLPDKIATNRSGQYAISNDAGIDNPLSLLFGKIDFQFIVTYVLSLMALIFMFSAVSGEKEDGTLRMLVANPVKRGTIMLAKVAGGFMVFLMPFLVSLVIVLLLLSLSGNLTLFTSEMLSKTGIIFAVSMLFLLVMFNLGSLVSAMTGRSTTSMIILLVVWVGLVLVIPKISPVLAAMIHPIKSQQVLKLEKKSARTALENERNTYLIELYEGILLAHDVTESRGGQQDVRDRANAQYDEEKTSIETEYAGRIAGMIQRIDEEYAAQKNEQFAIARNLSRFSPVSCFTYILSEIAGTGLLEIDNITETARQFQDRVRAEIYDHFIVKEYRTEHGASIMASNEEGFDSSTTPVPQMGEYRPVPLHAALASVYPDIILLALYAILFFAGAFVSFLRYDVR